VTEEIDLSKNAATLRKALERYVKAARRDRVPHVARRHPRRRLELKA